MNAELIVYYSGFVVAILLCRGLGPLFYIPMTLDLAFDLCLTLGLFSGWDIRWLVTGWGALAFLWVLTLAGTINKSTVFALVGVNAIMLYNKLWPQLTEVGDGQSFWNTVGTNILYVWFLSISVVVASTVFKSTVVARINGQFVDVLTNPKKRFLIPLGLWTSLILVIESLHAFLPEWLYDLRFSIGAHVLVFGWIALELPFYIKYKRIKKRFGNVKEANWD